LPIPSGYAQTLAQRPSFTSLRQAITRLRSSEGLGNIPWRKWWRTKAGCRLCSYYGLRKSDLHDVIGEAGRHTPMNHWAVIGHVTLAIGSKVL